MTSDIKTFYKSFYIEYFSLKNPNFVCVCVSAHARATFKSLIYFVSFTSAKFVQSRYCCNTIQ